MATAHKNFNSSTLKADLVGMINKKVGGRLTADDVVFGSMKAFDPPAVNFETGQRANTQVQISAKEGLPYEFTTTVHYNRIALETMADRLSMEFDGTITHSHDLIPALNELWGVTLIPDDLIGLSFDLSQGYPSHQLISANPRSLAVFGKCGVTLLGPNS